MGNAVFARTYQRDGEDWGGAADRVSLGNLSLVHDSVDDARLDMEYARMRRAMRDGVLLMSGRHLQQGDADQKSRPMEVFTNCSTAPWSFGKFYLLLNGSGVGRYYADDLMVVDWRNLPIVIQVLDKSHPDAHKADYFSRDELLSTLETKDIVLFDVPDTREGWAKAVEILETMAFEGTRRNTVVILDWSAVRPEGSPIGGMQNRPASGPLAPMAAIDRLASLRVRNLKPWKAAMYADHYLAESVQVGGARRAARIAVKPWTDEDILEFINIKEDGGLWSSNNSVGVDAEFWRLVHEVEEAQRDDCDTFCGGTPLTEMSEAHQRAWRIYHAIITAQYQHGTGEPGFLNLDQINDENADLSIYDDGIFAGSERYPITPNVRPLSAALVEAVKKTKYKYIVNPCGEIRLLVLGGYCVIADVAPFHAESGEQAREAFTLAARALMRVNLMESFYKKEVIRTNRIGVGFTGIFEFAWKFFGLAPRDLIADFDKLMAAGPYEIDRGIPGVKGGLFWAWMDETAREVEWTARDYAKTLGVVEPHTVLTVKPSGTTSKLFGLTEGAHLAASREYIRWVQFDRRASKDQIAEYESKGYMVQHIVRDRPTVAIVGFPTRPLIRTLGIPEEQFVTASEFTLDEHFKWLMLVEKFWLGQARGNQVSYTAKFDRKNVSFETYEALISEWMPKVRAVSVMAVDDHAEIVEKYGYAPEQPITAAQYDELTAFITQMSETLTDDDLRCMAGACPII